MLPFVSTPSRTARAAVLVPALLAVLLSANASPARADDAAAQVEVLYWIDALHDSTYRANVLVNNLSDAYIPDWKLAFDFPARVTSMEYARWTAAGAGPYRVEAQGVGWTKVIQPRKAVWFTVEGVYRDVAPEPSTCSFNGLSCVVVTEFEDDDGGDGGGDGNDPPAGSPDVTFRFTSVWSGGYVAQVSVLNTTGRAIEGWQLAFSFAPSITGIWNGRLGIRSGRYVVADAGWNRTIAPGDSAYFGFQGTFGAELPDPADCVFNGVACTFTVVNPWAPPDPGPVTGEVDVDFWYTSVWEDGYVAQVTITNGTNVPVNGWAVGFDLDAGIQTLWNGFLSLRNGQYLVRDAGWNRQILPGRQASFGFQGTYRGQLPEPSDCTFNGAPCRLDGFNLRATAVEEPASPETLPEALRLAPPYPNPFQDRTTVRFETEQPQAVTAELLDLQGRRLDVLFDGFASPGTPYTFTVSAGGLASGVYLVRVRGEAGFVETRRVVLMR